jgi:hypothetical protein
MVDVLHGSSSSPSSKHRRASKDRPLAGHESSSIPRRQRPGLTRCGDYSRGLGRFVILVRGRRLWNDCALFLEKLWE